MYVGIDLGTSEVKAVLVDEEERLHACASIRLAISHPHPGWSEQDPTAWWEATCEVMQRLRAAAAPSMAAVKGIGLSGQMHGAVLLDASGAVLRKAILWNDMRSCQQSALLERLAPQGQEITGNVSMPGYTAASLLWLKQQEPQVFSAIAKVLLPKDYLGFRLTGQLVTDVSDASGTYWFEPGRREWSETMLSATGLDLMQLPHLQEGATVRGELTEALKSAWGMRGPVKVAAGGGDCLVAAVGLGAVADGEALLSLGTSGVLVRSSSAYRPCPEQRLRTYCHALPGLWCNLSSTYSATASLSWAARLLRYANVAEFAQQATLTAIEHAPLFLPDACGYNTPHNDPGTQGVFFGLSDQTDPAALAFSVMEGIAYAVAEGCDAMRAGVSDVQRAFLVGGGARSDTWGRLIATICQMTLYRVPDAEFIGALGASRLARLAVSGESVSDVCRKPSIQEAIQPDARLFEQLMPRYERYRKLYTQLRGLWL